MKISDKDFNKLVQKAIHDQKTQAKAVEVLSLIHDKKENDIEAFAIATLVAETIKNIPGLKEFEIVKDK